MSTTKTKRAVSTRHILQDCIKDIEDGLWVCGELCEANDAEGATKPMGCALGLVGINAGYATIKNTPYGVSADVDYPKKDWSKSAIRAVTLLADTAHVTKDQRLEVAEEVAGENTDYAVPVEQGIVWRFNDSGSMTPRRALDWFKRALKTLDAA